MTKIIPILLVALLAVAGIFVAVRPSFNQTPVTQKPTLVPDQHFKKTQSPPSPQATKETSKKQDTVPLPSGEDAIRTFFELIHTNKIIPAINMLSREFVPNENTKQKVGVLFNSFTAIQPLEIKPYNQENWTDDWQKYEVTLDVAISLDDEEWVMQQYGWVRGKNKRWVKIVKQEEIWKIAVLATGP